MRHAGGVLLAALMWAGAAAAQGPNSACSPDVQKFCAGVNPGAGRIMACLSQHQADLSPGCKASLAQRAHGPGKPMAGGWVKSCEADIDKLCKDVPPGQGRVAQCLKSHADQLSPACKAALTNRPRRQAPAAAAAATAAPTPNEEK